MAKIPNKETLELFTKALNYNPITGLFTWSDNVRDFNNKYYPDEIAGTINDKGYRILTVKGHKLLAHRLVFYFMTNKYPTPNQVVDHINHIKDDNSYANLRLTTIQQNNLNKTLAKNNSTGIQGVWYCQRRQQYIAQIRKKGYKRWERKFDTLGEAECARNKQLKKMKFHKNHGKEHYLIKHFENKNNGENHD